MSSSSFFNSKRTVSFEQDDSFIIKVDKWIPNPEKPGYSMRERILQNQEVEAQIIDALKKIKIIDESGEEMTAYSSAEYVSYECFDDKFKATQDFPYPNGNIVVTCGHGNCEGRIIRIMVRDNNSNHFISFCSVKYFIDLPAVSQISLALNEAFHQGLFC